MSGATGYKQVADILIAVMSVVLTVALAKYAIDTGDPWRWVPVLAVGLVTYTRVRAWLDHRNKGDHGGGMPGVGR